MYSTFQSLDCLLTSRSNRQMDSGASVSSLDVSWGKWKSCFSHLRIGGKTDIEFHCKPSHTRCWRLSLCIRTAPMKENRVGCRHPLLKGKQDLRLMKAGFHISLCQSSQRYFANQLASRFQLSLKKDYKLQISQTYQVDSSSECSSNLRGVTLRFPFPSILTICSPTGNCSLENLLTSTKSLRNYSRSTSLLCKKV